MNDHNNFIYLVLRYDPSMGKEWALFAYDTPWEAEDQAKRLQKQDEQMHFVKAIRYFREVKANG